MKPGNGGGNNVGKGEARETELQLSSLHSGMMRR
jgi:hypothetical protein